MENMKKFYKIREYLFCFALVCLLSSCQSSKLTENNVNSSANIKLKESFMTGCISKAEGILGEKYCSCTYDKFVEKYGIREFIRYFASIGNGNAEMKPEDEEIIRTCILYDFELEKKSEINEEIEIDEKGETIKDSEEKIEGINKV